VTDARNRIAILEWAASASQPLGRIPALSDVSLDLALEARKLVRQLDRCGEQDAALELERELYRVGCRGVALWGKRRKFAQGAAPVGGGAIETEPVVALAARLLEAEPVRAGGSKAQGRRRGRRRRR
jgi:hypothetical protein